MVITTILIWLGLRTWGCNSKLSIVCPHFTLLFTLQERSLLLFVRNNPSLRQIGSNFQKSHSIFGSKFHTGSLFVSLMVHEAMNGLGHSYTMHSNTHTHISACLARKATFSWYRSLTPRQVQYLWVAAAFYSLSLTKMISISGTLPVNPAAQHITSAAITVSPTGCQRDELPGCHWEIANKIGFLSQG